MTANPTTRSPEVSTHARHLPGFSRPKKSQSCFTLPLILQAGLARALKLSMLLTSLAPFLPGDDGTGRIICQCCGG